MCDVCSGKVIMQMQYISLSIPVDQLQSHQDERNDYAQIISMLHFEKKMYKVLHAVGKKSCFNKICL